MFPFTTQGPLCSPHLPEIPRIFLGVVGISAKFTQEPKKHLPHGTAGTTKAFARLRGPSCVTPFLSHLVLGGLLLRDPTHHPMLLVCRALAKPPTTRQNVPSYENNQKHPRIAIGMALCEGEGAKRKKDPAQ